MPSKKPSVQTPAQNTAPSPLDEAKKLAVSAIDIAVIGRDSLHEMRAIFRAIHRLSGADETIHDLAYLGVTLADDRHNMLDCSHEEMQDKLAALREANHA